MPYSPIDPSPIEKTPKVSPDKTIEEGRISRPDSSSFEAYKNEAPSAVPGASGEISPMDLAAKAGITTNPTYQSLLAQAASAQDSLGEIEKNLKTPNLKLKKSQSELLDSKLNSANDHLGSAIEKLGGNVPEKTQVPKTADPVTRFISLVTDGQNHLIEAKEQLQNLKTKGPLEPTDMLLIQIKLAQAQQEIEYSSVLLSKVVDSLKQIINIQM
ncbi:MAG: hypothetical protein WCT85_03000 [Parachlamydiales bacterium]|jgi:hypothetical protein